MDRNSDQYSPSQDLRIQVLAAALLLFVALAQSPAIAKPELIDRVVAIVNEEPILYSDIQAKLARGQAVTVTEYPAKQSDSDFQKAVEDQINFELIMQKAEQLEIEVSDSELDAAIEQLMKERKFSLDSLRESLRREGISLEDYREDFRNRMIISEFHGKVIYPLIKLTDNDVENYFLKKNGKSSATVAIDVEQFSFALTGDPSKDRSVRESADSAYASLKSGVEPEVVAKKMSQAKGSAGFTKINFKVALSELNAVLKPRLEALSEGEASAPLELDGRLVVFLLNKRKLTGSSDFDSQKNMLLNELRAQESQNQTIRWLADQRRQFKPKVL